MNQKWTYLFMLSYNTDNNLIYVAITCKNKRGQLSAMVSIT